MHPSFGVFVTPTAAQPQRVVELAAHAEAVGLDLVTVQDHPYQPAFLDAWTLLSFIAARTERVQLAGNVLSLPLRPPAVLARSAASLDLLTGGRVALGLGAGFFWDAIAAMGGPRRTAGEGVDALREAVAVIRQLWAADERGGVFLDGDHYPIAGAKRGPAPAHPIPIWVGALKPRMLQLVGQHADGWLPSLSMLGSLEALDAGNAAVDAAARDAGRDPAGIRRLLNIGQGEASVEAMLQLMREHRVDSVILASDDAGAIARFGLETVPAVRAALAAG